MLKEYLTSIADSIRAKLGTSEKINAQDYADKISEVYDVGYAKGAEENSGDGAELARSIVDGTITEYVDDEIDSIRIYAFYNVKTLTSVNAPNVKTLSTYAFYRCNGLKTVYCPLITKVPTYAFYECANLTNIDLSNVTSLETAAFHSCTNLSITSMPNLTTITGSNVFANNTAITSIYFPLLSTIAQDSLRNMKGVTSVNLPSLTEIPSYSFANNSVMAVVDLKVASSIKGNVFYACNKLSTLILRKSDSICTLSATSAITSTPIASGTGYIYVPKALIDTYKSATNWVTYADQFRAIEDYTVDGTITGELDESKI